MNYFKLSDINKKKFKRVFIHEFGHYTARELNKSLFGVGEGVREIFLEERDVNGEIDYIGGTTPILPENYKDDGEIINPPQYIAVLLYGCIFQTLYQNTHFTSCFAIDKRANGRCDATAFSMITYMNGLRRSEVVEYVGNIYLKELVKNKKQFDSVFTFDFMKAISYSDTKYLVDLDFLRTKFASFLDEHSFYYENLIQEIVKIKVLDWGEFVKKHNLS